MVTGDVTGLGLARLVEWDWLRRGMSNGAGKVGIVEGGRDGRECRKGQGRRVEGDWDRAGSASRPGRAWLGMSNGSGETRLVELTRVGSIRRIGQESTGALWERNVEGAWRVAVGRVE
jgi:hypothetical protein